VLSTILKRSKVISSRQLVHENILLVAQWKIPHEGGVHVHFPRRLLVFTIIAIAHERNMSQWLCRSRITTKSHYSLFKSIAARHTTKVSILPVK